MLVTLESVGPDLYRWMFSGPNDLTQLLRVLTAPCFVFGMSYSISFTIWLEAIATRFEAIASRLEAIAIRLEAISFTVCTEP